MKKLVIAVGIVAAIATPAVAHFVDGYPFRQLALPTACGISLGVGLAAFAKFAIGKED